MNSETKSYNPEADIVNPTESVEMNKEFPVWKKITTGTYPNKESLIAALKKVMRFSDVTEIFLESDSFKIDSKPRERSLVKVKVFELGFTDDDVKYTHERGRIIPDIHEILKRAENLGLKLTIPEVAAQLILEEKATGKKNKGNLVIAHEPDRYGENFLIWEKPTQTMDGSRIGSASYAETDSSSNNPTEATFIFEK